MNIFWFGLERCTLISATIVISGLLARYFGPEVFGKWQYANTLLLVITPVTAICGAEILVPAIIHRPAAQLGAVLGSAFVLRFSVAAISLAVIWIAIAAGATDPLVGTMLMGLAVSMLFRDPVTGIITSWLQSMTYSQPLLLTTITAALIKTILVLLLVKTAVAPAHFGWLWAAEAASIGSVLVIYYMYRNGGTLGWRVQRTLLHHFSTSGIIFWLGIICMYLFMKLDRLMLERVISFADLGRYSVAQQINENWIIIAIMLSQTVAPAFVYRIQDPVQLRRNILRLILLAIVLITLGSCILDLFAHFIIMHIFGPDYEKAVSILRWAVWLCVPASVEAISNLIVFKYQAKYVLLAKWLFALSVAFIVNLIAIPRIGSYGALVGLAAGYIAALTINIYYLRFKLYS